MSNHLRCLVAAAVASVSMPLIAESAQPADTDARIRQLEQRITELEARQAGNDKEIARTVDALLRDAEQRSQLLAAGSDASAGYDNGFFIRAGDAWLFRPGAFFQFRGVANYRENVADADDEADSGFEIRRMKIELQGTAFTKNLQYFFAWNTYSGSIYRVLPDGTRIEVRSGGDVFLEDAWARYMFSDDWGVRVGQFKDPVGHEWLTHDGRQLAVERSLADAVLGGGLVGRTQAVTLVYGGYNANNPIYVEAGFTDGLNQLNTGFTGRPTPLTVDPILPVGSAHSVDWGVAGRVEFKAMGDWRNYIDFTSKGNKEDLLVFGAGGDWSQAGNGDVVVGTVDAQWENASGIGAYGALLMRHLEAEISGAADDATDWGALVQVGYLLNPQWEVFGRYDVIFFDNDVVFAGGVEDVFHEITIGVTRFLGDNGIAGNRAKITLDLTYLPNGSPGAFSGLGILNNNNGEEEWLLRGQFQLWI